MTFGNDMHGISEKIRSFRVYVIKIGRLGGALGPFLAFVHFALKRYNVIAILHKRKIADK